MKGPGATVVHLGRAGGGAARRRGRRRTAAVALLALLTPPALAGCGIQKSDVVEAGGAATLHVQPVPEDRLVLYFVGPDGRSMPVTRDLDHPGPEVTSPPEDSGEHTPTDPFGPDYEISRDDLRRGGIVTDKILAMLLAGPGANEAAAGITTALPGPKAGSPTMLQATEGPLPANPSTGTPARRLIWVRAPFPVKKLPEAGVRQLVCTTAYAEHPAGLVEVSLSGPDGILPTARCDE
ncbi:MULTISPECIES: hypothetical protein [unclassified Streptomyces]|uniref:hypothetical protein n=1 Tax=unclassified Streptomyces TaxID=2593676 RepID=UPI00296666F1|nr:hypothetical protein [Streptomyces sp. SJL17-1]